jgi:hypothetical protein
VSAIIRWEAPPPGSQRGRGHRVDHDTIAVELRSRPGEWGLLPASATGMAGQIRRGDIRAYRPAGTFEAVRRDDATGIKVWARYVGEESSCAA